MRVVVDMCLSPDLVHKLKEAGHDAQHWSSIGKIDALDKEILQWALEKQAVLLTHDLDFGDLLHGSKGIGPCVVIVREKDVDPNVICGPIIRVLEQFNKELGTGALISMGLHVARVRKLPLE